MQFKTAIILYIVAAASTTTFAPPIDSRTSELSRREEDLHRHHARDFDEAQEIEARGLPPDEEPQIRSPSSPGHMPVPSFRMPGRQFGGVGESHRKSHSYPYDRSDIQRLDTRSPYTGTRTEVDDAIRNYVQKNRGKKDLALPGGYN
ncbi:hypothetical protein CPB86DRAFT_399758 [Serendipita vermifera]|nr:hypothetical protein CPB86DRAFT_399758 [Serendipita vermifera]